MSRKRLPAGVKAMPSRRTIPERLPGAGRFSDCPEVYDATNLIAALKGIPWLRSAFARATEPPEGSRGPDRGPGDYGLLFLAFVHSSDVEIERWWNRARTDRRLLAVCGITNVPCYETVRKRFVELEGRLGEIESVVAGLVQHLRRHDPRIGAWLHVDATSAASHAVPIHDCPKGSCPGGKLPRRPPRLGQADANAHRQARGAAAFDEDEGPATVQAITSQPISERQPDSERGGVRYKSGGHWWWAADPDAGGRVYTRGKTDKVVRGWFGYYLHAAIDHYTGLPLALHVTGAHINESIAYPDLLDRATRTIGTDPLSVAGDRGISTDSVYRTNTCRGILTVVPWRKRHQTDPSKAPATSDYDEHGIPRCHYCGGSSDYVRFAVSGNNGRIWFRCAMPVTPDCTRQQTIRCSKAWRRLLPLPRTHDAYIELRRTHNSFEASHHTLRARFHLAGADSNLRTKRLGGRWQQLLANTGVLLGWLAFSYRLGLLAAPASYTPDPRQIRGHRRYATEHRTIFRKRLLERRARLGRLGGGGGGTATYLRKLGPDLSGLARGSP